MAVNVNQLFVENKNMSLFVLIRGMALRLLFYPSVILMVGCADSEKINEICANKYGDSIFSKATCIYNLNQEKAREAQALKKAEEKELAERAARPCIAKDLDRMEGLAKKLSTALLKDTTPEEMLSMLKNNNLSPQTTQAKDNIKEQVVIGVIQTQCPSEFNLLVNVRFDEKSKPKWIRYWAQNAPLGYDDSAYSTIKLAEKDFEYETRRKAIQHAEEEAKRKRVENEEREAAVRRKERENDPCAPGLSRSERLSRLAKFGAVREVGHDDYKAGGRQVRFSLIDPNSILWCN